MTVSAGTSGTSTSPLVELTPLPAMDTINTVSDRDEGLEVKSPVQIQTSTSQNGSVVSPPPLQVSFKTVSLLFQIYGSFSRILIISVSMVKLLMGVLGKR